MINLKVTPKDPAAEALAKALKQSHKGGSASASSKLRRTRSDWPIAGTGTTLESARASLAPSREYPRCERHLQLHLRLRRTSNR